MRSETVRRSLRPEWSSALLHLSCLLVLTVGIVKLRAPAHAIESFRNEDIAGITYNADLLRRGGLPLVDNLEYKAPGSFFLTWMAWAVGGRSVRTLETLGVCWAVLSAVGVYLGAMLMFGTASGCVAALLYAVLSPITDSLTVNYNSWMIGAYIWSTVLFIAGLRYGRKGWFVAAGASIVWAALLKRQGGVLLPLFVVLLCFGHRLQRPYGWPKLSRARAATCYLTGMAVAYLPLLVLYSIRGGWRAAIRFTQHFVFSPSGWKYAAGEVGWEGKLDRLQDGLAGFGEFLALPTLLASMALVCVPRLRRRGWSLLGVILGGQLVLSVVGLSLGFRFYRGYYLQALPALVWLAAHRRGPILRWFAASSRSWTLETLSLRCVLIVSLALICLPAGLSDLSSLKNRLRGRNSFPYHVGESKRIATLIRRNSSDNDRIWVWGRWGWPIYFFANRLSAIPYYKVLGVITTNLDNTWKRPTSPTRFNHQGPWREIADQLLKAKPLFVVEARNEIHAGFLPFERMLQRQYRRVPLRNVRAFYLHVRKQHALLPPHGPTPAVRVPGPGQAGRIRSVAPGAAHPSSLVESGADMKIPHAVEPTAAGSREKLPRRARDQ